MDQFIACADSPKVRFPSWVPRAICSACLFFECLGTPRDCVQKACLGKMYVDVCDVCETSV
jgi:hypothetical protein